MKYVTKRKGSDNFLIRYPIPAYQQSTDGRKEVWRSLGTADRNLAERKAHKVVADIQAELDKHTRVEAKKEILVKPTREMLKNAALSFYEIQVEADLGERAHDPDFVSQVFEKKRYKRAAKELRKQFALGNFDAVDDEYWSDHFGFCFQDNPVLKREFALLLMRAEIEATERFAEHDRGVLGGTPKDTLFRAPKRTVGAFVSDAEAVYVGKDDEPQLVELFELHRTHIASSVKADTVDQREKIVLRFSEFVGKSVKPTQVTKTQAREWRNQLRNWPVKADQRADFRGLKFSEIIEKNRVLGISPIVDRTMAKYLSQLSAFFDWLVDDGYVEVNVFKGLIPKIEKHTQNVFPLSEDQLITLFSSPLFLGCKSDDGMEIVEPGGVQVRDWRFWLPILGAFSGARQGELAQLELVDIENKDGIDFLHITNQGQDPAKSVKNAYSRRRLPIHSEVLRMGFLQYVKEQQRKGETRVFPEVERDSRGSFANVSKFYQKCFNLLGLKNDPSRNVVFHSLRHSFSDQLRENYTQDQFMPLLGHSGKSTTGGYGERESLSLEIRKAMIESVRYSCVDWASISAYPTKKAKSYKEFVL